MAEASETERGILRIDFRAGRELHMSKVIWSRKDNATDDKFIPLGVSKVDVEVVTDYALELRAILNDLVDAYLKHPGASQAGTLKALARKGRELRDAVFHDEHGSGAACQEADSYLKTSTPPPYIQLVVDGCVSAPWGLIYDGDPEALPDDADFDEPDAYDAFWCSRFLVSCVDTRIEEYGIEVQKPEDGHRVLFVMHEKELIHVLGIMPEQERDLFWRLAHAHGGAIFTSSRLLDEWQRLGEISRILFFYCHANGKNLALSATDTVGTTFIKRKLSTSGHVQTTASFAFLNGCSTAVAAEGSSGFITATTRPGLFGFIGTEVAVPNVYALRFGLETVAAFLETGMSIAEILGQLRARHWPLGLIYGLYANPFLAVRRECTLRERPNAPKMNFSRGPLGSKRM